MSAKEFMKQFDFDFTKGKAEYYMKLSLERPLTSEELSRYKELCKKLGYPQ